MSIDFLTDLPLTERGNKHILVCCDHFTRWVEVFPLPDMSAVTVARTLADQVFSRFGCPERLHSDCAANFKSQVISELCRIMGVEKTNTTAFHPQGNSRCERVNRTILDMLSKYLSDSHSEWDRHLPLLMLGYRAQVHRSVGYSPFYLMFGREPRLPVDTELDVPHVVRAKSAAAYVDELCDGLRDAYREALKSSDASHQRNKRLYDRRAHVHQYKVGDPVLVHRAAAKRGEYYKFRRPWVPAVVEAVKGDVYLRVRLEDGKIIGVHHNKLKPRVVSAVDADASQPVRSRQTQAGTAASVESDRVDSPHCTAQSGDSHGAGVTRSDTVEEVGSDLTLGDVGETGGRLSGSLTAAVPVTVSRGPGGVVLEAPPSFPAVQGSVPMSGETSSPLAVDPPGSFAVPRLDSSAGATPDHSQSMSDVCATDDPVQQSTTVSVPMSAPMQDSMPESSVSGTDAHSPPLDARSAIPRRSSRKTKPPDRLVLRFFSESF